MLPTFDLFYAINFVTSNKLSSGNFFPKNCATSTASCVDSLFGFNKKKSLPIPRVFCQKKDNRTLNYQYRNSTSFISFVIDFSEIAIFCIKPNSKFDINVS